MDINQLRDQFERAKKESDALNAQAQQCSDELISKITDDGVVFVRRIIDRTVTDFADQTLRLGRDKLIELKGRMSEYNKMHVRDIIDTSIKTLRDFDVSESLGIMGGSYPFSERVLRSTRRIMSRIYDNVSSVMREYGYYSLAGDEWHYQNTPGHDSYFSVTPEIARLCDVYSKAFVEANTKWLLKNDIADRIKKIEAADIWNNL